MDGVFVDGFGLMEDGRFEELGRAEELRAG